MKKTKSILIDGKSYIVNEMSVGQLTEFYGDISAAKARFQEGEISLTEGIREAMEHGTSLLNKWLPILVKEVVKDGDNRGFEVSELQKMYPSDLLILEDAIKAVNSGFLTMSTRLEVPQLWKLLKKYLGSYVQKVLSDISPMVNEKNE